MRNQITSLGRPKGKATQRATPAELLQAEQVIARERVQSIPEIELLQNVPGIGPFIAIPEFIPDMVYVFQLEGLNSVMAQMFPGSNPLLKEVSDVFRRSTINETVKYISDLYTRLGGTTTIAPELILQILNRDGITRFSTIIAAADPLKPESVIFEHPSQEIFKTIQKVEAELIKNEPDVIESTDIKCAGCKQSKVKKTPVQLRSADEAADWLITCVVCHRHWIIRS